MEAELAVIFERVLRPDKRTGRDIQPIDEAGEHEAQRGTAAEYRQGSNFGGR